MEMMEMFDFSKISVLVVGDVMLEVYYKGAVERISPEAPVPIVRVENVKHNIGGAGNVCNNIVNLGGNTYLLGFVGDDDNYKKLSSLLTESKINNFLVETIRPTVTKMRVLGEHQQIVRVDFEDKIANYSTKDYELLKKNIEDTIDKVDIVVISDYKKGVCSSELCKHLISVAKSKDKKVIVDPKGTSWNKYIGAYFVTPNLKELKDISGKEFFNENDSIVKTGLEVLDKFDFENLLVTRSEKGMSLINKKEIYHLPANAKEVYDVSGAGDTVIATLALSIARGIDKYESIKLANTAGGIVVGKLGTVPVTKTEIEESFYIQDNHKLISLDKLLIKLKDLKEKNNRIVFTNGCFDIIHKGHISYMVKAKQLGDILIIGLNSDSSVKILKGESRPINNQFDRAEILAAFNFVDYVVFFEEETPYNLIKAVAPDVLVKGGDYKVEDIVGREFAKEVAVIDFVDGYSTTNTIKRMKG